MKIEVLRTENVHFLNNIAKDVFDNPINPESLTAFIECPRHMMVLAVENDEVIGMASAVEYFHPDKPSQLWINEIGVSPKMQNQKIGRQLLQKLLDLGKERKCVFAWLGTDTDNFPAHRCFNSTAPTSTPQLFLLYEWEY